MKSIIKKIGILGGTFDPAHLGHIKISKEAKKKFKLEKIYWAVTNKNPFKSKIENRSHAMTSNKHSKNNTENVSTN